MNATVSPILNFDTRARTFDGGVYDQHGQYCAMSEQLKAGYKNVHPEHVPSAEYHLQGTHLFAGMVQNRHFGHFLIESLCRLWPLKKWQGLEGIVFTVRSPQAAIAGFVEPILSRLAPGVPVRFVTEVTSVDELVIPTPICHVNNGALLNHPLHQTLLHQLRTHDDSYPKKVYVSRSKLSHRNGLLVSETYLESQLEKEGYTVIHPQELSLEAQLAYYTNAEQLIFADGSAFHLFVLVANPQQRVFIVWRRKKNSLFDRQLESFTGTLTDGSCCIKGVYAPDQTQRQSNRLKAVLDFKKLSNQLYEKGYISSSGWAGPEPEAVEKQVQVLAKQSKTSLYYFDEAIG